MWAELETGSSSAGPWTMPSATARRVGDPCLPSAALKRRSSRCGLRRGTGAAVAPAAATRAA